MKFSGRVLVVTIVVAVVGVALLGVCADKAMAEPIEITFTGTFTTVNLPGFNPTLPAAYTVTFYVDGVLGGANVWDSSDLTSATVLTTDFGYTASFSMVLDHYDGFGVQTDASGAIVIAGGGSLIGITDNYGGVGGGWFDGGALVPSTGGAPGFAWTPFAEDGNNWRNEALTGGWSLAPGMGGGDPVPEPATLALFGLGAAGLVVARRRKRKTA